MSRSVNALLASALGFHLAACATIVSGTDQNVSFYSNPESVAVTVYKRILNEEGKPWEEKVVATGKTPAHLYLTKDDDQQVRFSKEGYKPLTMRLTTRLDSWFWGNLVFGGLFGSTTDSLSGAIHEYEPSQYFVTLIPTIGSTVENATVAAQRDWAREFIVR